MFKNAASQKIALFAFNQTSGAPQKTDSANLLAYLSKDFATVTSLGDSTATEMDSTNAPGWYLWDLTTSETNADVLLVTGKSATSSVSVVGQLIYTMAANANVMSIDASGRVDIGKILGSAVDTTATQLGVRVNNAAGVAWASGAITAGVFAAGAIDSAAFSTTGITRIQAGLATPTNITAGTITTATNVTNLSAGAIAAASFAAGAIDSAAFSTTGITRIQAGLATPTNITAATGVDVTQINGVNVSSATAQVGARVVVIDTGPVNSVADGMLDRNMATGTDSGSTTVRTPRQALRFLRNKWSIAAGVLQVLKEDDATPTWSAAVSSDAAAVPIIGSDPTGP